MAACPLCGLEIISGQTWTEIGGVRVHWDCWVKAGKPMKLIPTLPTPLRRYVIPRSLGEEFVKWNRKAKAVSESTEWGGNLYLKGEEVTLGEAVIGEELKVKLPPLADAVRNALGGVHYHPYGGGPSMPDLASWLARGVCCVSPNLHPLFIITCDESYLWYLTPKGDVLLERYRQVLNKLREDKYARVEALDYFLTDPETAVRLFSGAIAMKEMLEDKTIRSGEGTYFVTEEIILP